MFSSNDQADNVPSIMKSLSQQDLHIRCNPSVPGVDLSSLNWLAIGGIVVKIGAEGSQDVNQDSPQTLLYCTSVEGVAKLSPS